MNSHQIIPGLCNTLQAYSRSKKGMSLFDKFVAGLKPAAHGEKAVSTALLTPVEIHRLTSKKSFDNISTFV